MTEAALLCDRLERQIRLRLKPPLRFLQPQPPKCDIGRGATLVEKAAPQGPQPDPKLFCQIAFAQPDRQGFEHQLFGLADEQHGRQGVAIETLAARDGFGILPWLARLCTLPARSLARARAAIWRDSSAQTSG